MFVLWALSELIVIDSNYLELADDWQLTKFYLFLTLIWTVSIPNSIWFWILVFCLIISFFPIFSVKIELEKNDSKNESSRSHIAAYGGQDLCASIVFLYFYCKIFGAQVWFIKWPSLLYLNFDYYWRSWKLVKSYKKTVPVCKLLLKPKLKILEISIMKFKVAIWLLHKLILVLFLTDDLYTIFVCKCEFQYFQLDSQENYLII